LKDGFVEDSNSYKYSLRPTARICDENPNVDAENGYDHTEQHKCRYFADKANTDQHRYEHNNEKARAIHSVIVEGIGWN
jgi:hypothetical protein